MKEKFESTQEEREAEPMSKWVLIYNMDAIMHNNNILDSPPGTCPNLPLDNLCVLRVDKLSEARYFTGRIDHLWMPMSLETGNPIIAEIKDHGLVMLAYESLDDANRLTLAIENDLSAKVTAQEVPMKLIEKECDETGKLIGLVVPSFVTPAHFGGKLL